MKFIISSFLLFVSVVDAKTKIHNLSKVYDGTTVRCQKNENINNRRTGAYKVKISKLQVITNTFGQAYLRFSGQIQYFRCEYTSVGNKAHGKFKLNRFDHPYHYYSQGLNNDVLNIRMVGRKPTLYVIQDGKYEVLASINLNLSENQKFHFQIPAKKLEVNLGQTGEPDYKTSIDLFLQVKFDFNVTGRKPYSKLVSYVSFRVHFTIEKEMNTEKHEKRWQVTLL